MDLRSNIIPLFCVCHKMIQGCRFNKSIYFLLWLVFIPQFLAAQSFNAYISVDRVNDSIYEFPFLMEYSFFQHQNASSAHPIKNDIYILDKPASNGTSIPVVKINMDTIVRDYLISDTIIRVHGRGRLNINQSKYVKYKSLDSFLIAFRHRGKHDFRTPFSQYHYPFNDLRQLNDSGATVLCKVYHANFQRTKQRTNHGPVVTNKNNLSLYCDAIYRSPGIVDSDLDSLHFYLSELVEIRYRNLRIDEDDYMFKEGKWGSGNSYYEPTRLHCASGIGCPPNPKKYYPVGIHINPTNGDLTFGIGNQDANAGLPHPYVPITTAVQEFKEDSSGNMLQVTESYYLSHFFAVDAFNGARFGPKFPNQASRLVNTQQTWHVCAGDTLKIPIRTTEGQNYSFKTPLKNEISWNESISNGALRITDTAFSKKQAIFEWVPTKDDIQSRPHQFTLFVETDSTYRSSFPKFGQSVHVNSYTFQIHVHHKADVVVSRDSITCGKLYYSANDTSGLPGIWTYTWELKSLDRSKTYDKKTGSHVVLEAPEKGEYLVELFSENRTVECPSLDADTAFVSSFLRFDKLKDTSVCINDSLKVSLTLIDSISAVSYSWQTQRRFLNHESPVFYADDSTVEVTVHDGTCSYSQTFDIAPLKIPDVDIGRDTMLCTGSSLLFIRASEFTNGLWNESDTSGSFIAYAPDTVTFSTIDSNQCRAIDTAYVESVPLPTYSFSVDGTSCSGEKLTLELKDSSSAISSVKWISGLDTISGIRHSLIPDDDLFYQVVVAKDTLDQRCHFSHFHLFLIHTPDQITLSYPDTICESQLPLDLVHSADVRGTVLWENDTSLFDPLLTKLIQYESAESHWVKYIDTNGCTSYDTAFIVVENIDSARVLQSDIPNPFCYPNSVALLGGKTTYNNDLIWYVNDAEIGSGLVHYIPTEDTTDGTAIIFSYLSEKSSRCNDRFVLESSVLRRTPKADFILTPDEGCSPLRINARSTSNNVLNWELSGFGIGSSIAIDTFLPEGKYNLRSIAMNPFCSDTSNKSIEVFPSPKVEITSSLNEVNIDLPEITFTADPNRSDYEYDWRTSDGGTGSSPVWKYRFPAIGTYWVNLTVTNGMNCEGFDSDTIVVLDKVKILIPSSFTPNNDAINDYFLPISINGVTDWKMVIYNRWGEKMYEGSFPSVGWDGKTNNFEALPGIYVYVIEFLDTNGEDHELKGHVQLMR